MNQLIESLMLVQKYLDTLSDKIFKHIFRVFSETVYLSKLDLRKSIKMENLWITMVTSFWILSLRLLAFPFVFHLFKEIWILFFLEKRLRKLKTLIELTELLQNFHWISDSPRFSKKFEIRIYFNKKDFFW